jgi:hypothetical protein
MTTALQPLPGGLPGPDGLRRSYAFRGADGELEMALTEAVDEAHDTPDAVSRALLSSLAELADDLPSRTAVDALCVADRQFLMRALDVHLGRRSGWFDATCAHCACAFDFPLDPAQLPIKPAGRDFPLTHLTLDQRPLTLRVPTGADQLRALRTPRPARRERLLRDLEVVDPMHHSALPEVLSAEDFARCEEALEAQAPEVACTVSAPCPECGHANAVDIDPYGALARNPGGLLAEVHQLAWHYHWSESEILGLPRARRMQYLALIGSARGMSA